MNDSFPDFTRAEYAPPPVPPVPMPYRVQAAGDPLFWRAVLFGCGGALAGSLLYALVGHWITIGFVAIIVGAMIGTAMMRATGGVGGRRYQVAAVVLLYFAVSFALALDVVWEMASHGQDPGTWVPAHPFLLLSFVLAGPFLVLLGSFTGGAIGLLILFFGMQAAWRVCKGGQDFSPGNKPAPGSMLGLR